jgi:hypothetical protein
MLPADRRTRSRLALSAAIGGTAVLATALIVITSNLATDTAAAGVALEPAAAVSTDAQLDDIDLPDPPSTCSAQQLADRDQQVQLLHDEQANEQRVLDTVTDGSREDKLGAIRDRAEIIIGRIDQIDGRCPVERPGAPSSDPATPEAPVVVAPDSPVPAPAPAGDAAADRTLAALAISCDEADLTGVDQAAADRAQTELDANQAQLNGRLTTEFPRFSARVAREADPTAASTEFAALAADLADTLEARRTAILQRAGLADAATVAATCDVVPAATG